MVLYLKVTAVNSDGSKDMLMHSDDSAWKYVTVLITISSAVDLQVAVGDYLKTSNMATFEPSNETEWLS